MAKKKAVTAIRETAVVAFMDDMAGDAGLGMENLTADDIAIPFFGILQKNSPQCDADSPVYMVNAVPGTIMNSVTLEIFNGDTGILVIPCGYQKRMVEWHPRESSQKGIVAIHDMDSDYVSAATKHPERPALLITANGTQLVETADHYCLFLHPSGRLERVIIGMTSTQLKKSKRWNSIAMNQRATTSDGRTFQPPSFAYIYKLTTVGESNSYGSWRGWSIEMARMIDSQDLYTEAKLFNEAINNGIIKTSDRVVETEKATEETLY